MPGIWTDRGSRWASFDDPASDPGADRPGVVEDDVGKPVAGDDRPPDAGLEVAAVDRQRVVRDDLLQRVGDHLEDALRVTRRDQPLVDLEQAALAREPVLELPSLPVELIELVQVDHRLGCVSGEDRQGRLVVGAEPVAAEGRDHDHPVDVAFEADRDREERLRTDVQEALDRPWIRLRVAEEDALVVRRDPARDALADPDPEAGRVGRRRSAEGPLEAEDLTGAGVVVDPVEPDRVGDDQALGALDEDPRDLVEVARPVQPDGELLDGLEPCRERSDGVVQAGVADGGRHLVGEAAGDRRLLGGPLVDPIVVQDEEPQGLPAEDDRREADAADPVPPVDVAHRIGQVVDERVAEGDDLAGPDGDESGRLVVRPERRHPFDDFVADAVLGREAERVRAALVVQPEPHPSQGEQGHRVGNEIGHDRLEVELAADLRGDPTEGVRARGRVVGDLDRVGLRRSAGEPEVEVAPPHKRLVAGARHGRQPTREAPGARGRAGDPGGGGDFADAEERVGVRWLVGDGHLVRRNLSIRGRARRGRTPPGDARRTVGARSPRGDSPEVPPRGGRRTPPDVSPRRPARRHLRSGHRRWTEEGPRAAPAARRR